MYVTQMVDALRCADQADQSNVLRAVLLQTVNGSDCRICRGHYRRYNDDKPLSEIGRSLEEVLDRGKSLRLAVHPNMSDARRRNQLQHPFGEGNSGT